MIAAKGKGLLLEYLRVRIIFEDQALDNIEEIWLK
jgi:hypothetical protein